MVSYITQTNLNTRIVKMANQPMKAKSQKSGITAYKNPASRQLSKGYNKAYHNLLAYIENYHIDWKHNLLTHLTEKNDVSCKVHKEHLNIFILNLKERHPELYEAYHGVIGIQDNGKPHSHMLFQHANIELNTVEYRTIIEALWPYGHVTVERQSPDIHIGAYITYMSKHLDKRNKQYAHELRGRHYIHTPGLKKSSKVKIDTDLYDIKYDDKTIVNKRFHHNSNGVTHILKPHSAIKVERRYYEPHMISTKAYYELLSSNINKDKNAISYMDVITTINIITGGNQYMKRVNLLEETLRVIEQTKHNENDIDYIVSEDKMIPWKLFKEAANYEYNAGYGRPYVNVDTKIVFKDETWLGRYEYDGAEDWLYYKKPYRTNNVAQTQEQAMMALWYPEALDGHLKGVAAVYDDEMEDIIDVVLSNSPIVSITLGTFTRNEDGVEGYLTEDKRFYPKELIDKELLKELHQHKSAIAASIEHQQFSIGCHTTDDIIYRDYKCPKCKCEVSLPQIKNASGNGKMNDKEFVWDCPLCGYKELQEITKKEDL